MIDFKLYGSANSKKHEQFFLKKIYYFLREPILIGSLNGCVSGAIAAIFSTYGYIAFPGFGPVIAMGIGIALPTGIIIGTMIGSMIGIAVGIFCIFMENLSIS
ncbi:hypothetical protein V3565_00375 [Bartonella sp. B10]